MDSNITSLLASSPQTRVCYVSGYENRRATGDPELENSLRGVVAVLLLLLCTSYSFVYIYIYCVQYKHDPKILFHNIHSAHVFTNII